MMVKIFETCAPRPEILAGQLPDSIFAADLWDVVAGKAHPDYAEPEKFFLQTYSTQNLKLLLKDAAERLAGITGANPVHYLETGFGGGKTHALIASVHVAREGERIEKLLSSYGVSLFPKAKETKIGVFVGENTDPLNGTEHVPSTGGKKTRTFTPWGWLALMIGGPGGFETVRENDEKGGAPSRVALEEALQKSPQSDARFRLPAGRRRRRISRERTGPGSRAGSAPPKQQEENEQRNPERRYFVLPFHIPASLAKMSRIK